MNETESLSRETDSEQLPKVLIKSVPCDLTQDNVSPKTEDCNERPQPLYFQESIIPTKSDNKNFNSNSLQILDNDDMVNAKISENSSPPDIPANEGAGRQPRARLKETLQLLKGKQAPSEGLRQNSSYKSVTINFGVTLFGDCVAHRLLDTDVFPVNISQSITSADMTIQELEAHVVKAQPGGEIAVVIVGGAQLLASAANHTQLVSRFQRKAIVYLMRYFSEHFVRVLFVLPEVVPKYAAIRDLRDAFEWIKDKMIRFSSKYKNVDVLAIYNFGNPTDFFEPDAFDFSSTGLIKLAGCIRKRLSKPPKKLPYTSLKKKRKKQPDGNKPKIRNTHQPKSYYKSCGSYKNIYNFDKSKKKPSKTHKNIGFNIEDY